MKSGSEKPDFTKMGSFMVKVTEITHNTGNSPHTREQWKLLKAKYKDKFEIVDIRHKTANFFVSEGDEILIEWITNTSSTPGYYSQRKLLLDPNPFKANPNNEVPF